MKRLFGISLILGLILVLASGCFQAKQVLNVGTDATYEPFEYIDESGNYVGFDMELIKMVADELGMELKIHNVNWDGIIPGLINGNYDCLISAMTITEERQKQISFSDPYFSIKQVIVVKTDNDAIKGPADLAGKTVTAQIGTTGDLYASKIAGVKMKRFDTNPQAVQELLNNNADAAVMDDLVASEAINKNPDLKMIEITDAEVEYYGIGVKKENTELLEKINKALETLRNNGKLAELEQKYKSGD
ncbi:MAG: basic amino acid ABC transporter substrate-binding protein [Firmicutes bacterium]|nr:basic amino acid ABC transporter substrate-binding protein [Bacillota bacterium]